MTDRESSSSGGTADQLREEAAAWFARMRGEDAASHRAAFENWLALGAAHRAAYNRIGAIFAAAKVLKDDDPVRRGGVLTGRTSAASIALVGVIVIIPLALWVGHPRRDPSVASQSALPARQTIEVRRLPTGGEVILDADAKLTPDLTGQPALSRLEGGRARFLLQHAAIPDHILAGSFEVQATAATFDLWLRPDGSLEAEALAGDLHLRPAVLSGPIAGGRWLRVSTGQHVRMIPSGHVVALAQSAGNDWPHGVLEYRGRPLAEVLEEANRYSPIKIVLADPALGSRRISGRFRVSDPVVLARRLAAALTLAVDASRAGEVVLATPKKISPAP